MQLNVGLGPTVLKLFEYNPLYSCDPAKAHQDIKNTMELYSNNLRAAGTKPSSVATSVEDETEQKARQENKSERSKQGK